MTLAPYYQQLLALYVVAGAALARHSGRRVLAAASRSASGQAALGVFLAANAASVVRLLQMVRLAFAARGEFLAALEKAGVPAPRTAAVWDSWAHKVVAAVGLPAAPVLARGVHTVRGLEYAYVHVHSLKLDVYWDGDGSAKGRPCFMVRAAPPPPYPPSPATTTHH